MRASAGLVPALSLGFVLIWGHGAAGISQDVDTSCGDIYELFRRAHPDITWMPAQQGLVLQAFDAILVCEGSVALVRSMQSIASPYISWRKSGSHYLGHIASRRVVVMHPESHRSGPAVRIELLKTTGRVYYSTDKEQIQRYGILGLVQRGSDRSNPMDQERDLKGLRWISLNEQRLLAPLDMIWTQADGRVEIEILQEKVVLRDPDTAVRGPRGELTNKVRLPRNTFFVVDPQFVTAARVTRVIGRVLVSTEKDRVREFLKRHGAQIGFLRGMDAQARAAWRAILQSPDLN